MHLVINYLVNNLYTLSIWSIRLANLLTFEKGDEIMDAYSKIEYKLYMHLIIL